MALSPLDIHNKEFSRSMFRGYDEDEVNEFLEQVLKDYENVLEEKKTLENSLKQSTEQVTHFNTIETTLQKSILTAQEAAEDVRRNSMKEAKLIIKEAEKNADRIVNEALSRAQKIAVEIEDLKKQSKVFRNRFKMLIEAQLDLVQSSDWDELLEYKVDAEKLHKVAEER
ncbi:DivIVA domain-containing protein [Sporosarcina sp. Marseille-Q4063]|uniref:DivIVA domain-containing protein n=1 Tax=Sporosarcina sp. Marseille-Q4063 TaxID=2810514 RepID=UPI001BAED7E7|nr:DivIVA domain-containing protein [Sporosarcina sp. Marseille-Q4063]QUW21811.1 DivIVA domain-containing protein [Sporosarcina sp. Marseille-Q4063]